MPVLHPRLPTLGVGWVAADLLHPPRGVAPSSSWAGLCWAPVCRKVLAAVLA
jgi:hypothetical protein